MGFEGIMRCRAMDAAAGRAAAGAGHVGAAAFGAVSAPRACSDVIVVGGGLAGLATAHQLQRQGAAVVLLEARSRVGGRVHTQVLETGQAIDLGAQFIGDAQRRISSLVDEVGLTRVPPHEQADHLYFRPDNGQPVRVAGDALPLPLLSQIDAFFATRRFDRSLLDHRDQVARLDNLPASALVRAFTCTQAAEAFLSGFAEGEMCVPLDEISAFELLSQAASIGGRDAEARSMQWFLAEGAEPLAHHLRARLGRSVVLDAPVQRVEVQADRVRVETPGGTRTAAQLVVAVPPQLYERLGLLPWLPEAHARVLRGYKHGHVVKTLLAFDRPWWRALGLSGRIQDAGGLFNAVVDASPADGRLGLLVLFSTAGSGRRLRATATETGRIERALEWLRTSGAATIPPLRAARSVDWTADPWSMGGYASHRAPGGWQEAPALFASRGRIHFAGTETATAWRSFMEGALESAERAAGAVRRHAAPQA